MSAFFYCEKSWFLKNHNYFRYLLLISSLLLHNDHDIFHHGRNFD